MRRLIVILGLELYALALTVLQAFGGVRTDEAKYLLNIPYPHPPAIRWVFSLLENVPFQEWVWRFVLATLMVQAAWLVWSMAHDFSERDRRILWHIWLLSAAVVFQAGSIMMAPVTGLQALVFVWLWMRPDIDMRKHGGWTLLFWLFSLFTAYQAALFVPLVIALLRRAKYSWVSSFLLAGIPGVLLGLYTFSNPLALASFFNAAGDNAAFTQDMVVRYFVLTWAIAGSIVLVPSGVLGFVKGRAWVLLGTFALVSVYNYASVHTYYAILFTPLLLAGSILWARRATLLLPWLLCGTILGTALLWPVAGLVPVSHSTRETIRALSLNADGGPLLIHGSFGHEWQYESPVAVRRFVPAALSKAQAIVCLTACPEGLEGWVRVQNAYLEAYRRP
jgi:hypothetical protein